jgi:hypothetical protein
LIYKYFFYFLDATVLSNKPIATQKVIEPVVVAVEPIVEEKHNAASKKIYFLIS